MASVSVDHGIARKNLHAAWAKIDDPTYTAPPRITPYLEAVIEASDVTYKYILVTGLLGKFTNPSVHPRAIQVNSSLADSYDARSLCHDVVVTFEKTKGDLWGLSNEPFLNKPARHPEHYKTNTQLRNKRLAATLHDALDYAHQSQSDAVFAMLVHVLRLSRQRAASQVAASVQVETTYRKVVEFARRLLEITDGGNPLVAVTGTFISLMNHGFSVKVYQTTSSDKFSKTAGDIEIYHDDQLVSAYECKQRPITLDDIRHGIRKAKENSLLEYVFVISNGYAANQQDAIRAEVGSIDELDAIIIDMNSALPDWTAALNPKRRSVFGETAVGILRSNLRRKELADSAAEIWNSLE
jgi:hypothetical protein